MFDRLIYAFFGAIDNFFDTFFGSVDKFFSFFDRTWNWLTARRCKCKLKKGKNGRRTSNNK